MYYPSTLPTREPSPRELPLTDIHIDYIMYLLETKQVSPLLTRASEIIITENCSIRVAEDLIQTLKGLRPVGTPRPTLADIKAMGKASQAQAYEDTKIANAARAQTVWFDPDSKSGVTFR